MRTIESPGCTHSPLRRNTSTTIPRSGAAIVRRSSCSRRFGIHCRESPAPSRPHPVRARPFSFAAPLARPAAVSDPIPTVKPCAGIFHSFQSTDPTPRRATSVDLRAYNKIHVILRLASSDIGLQTQPVPPPDERPYRAARHRIANFDKLPFLRGNFGQHPRIAHGTATSSETLTTTDGISSTAGSLTASARTPRVSKNGFIRVSKRQPQLNRINQVVKPGLRECRAAAVDTSQDRRPGTRFSISSFETSTLAVR